MEFNFNNDRPIYLQLAEQLEIFIISGKVKPGERLLSVRELAMQAQVNPNTMQRALVELENHGLIYAERTSGRFITNDQRLLTDYREKYAHAKAQQFYQEMEDLGFSKLDVVNHIIKEGGFNE